MKLILVMLLLFSPYTALSNVITETGDDEILETVFRYQIQHCYESLPPRHFFLSYKQQDLSNEFMDRFKSHESRVRKRSQMFGFKDKETGERGVLLAVGSVNRRSHVKAEVRASCIAAMLDAYSYVYLVVRKNGRWIVRKARLTGVA